MPALFACLAVSASLIGSAESKFKRSIVLGATVSTTVAMIYALEITEVLRRMDYWNWSEDWPTILLVAVGYGFVGAAIGLAVACLHRCWLHFICVRKRAITSA